MCNCGGSRRNNQTWTITYPADSGKEPEVKTNAAAARIAASKVPGATWGETPK